MECSIHSLTMQQARTDSEMSKACWIMILQACRDMRAVVSAFVPADHMPPPVLPTFGILPHGSSQDPLVPIAVDGPHGRFPSDPLYPPALQSAADVHKLYTLFAVSHAIMFVISLHVQCTLLL